GEADQHIWVRKGAETIRLDVQTIDWIEAEGEYVRIHAGAASFLERGSLTDATARLAPFGFVRIHRSAVINPDQVVAVEKSGWGGLVLRLGSGARVPVGRKYREVARALTAPGL
ncbi:MAG TPA: LytTR family DNA-binding domain-containing protein, partial [Allosphingosinicella sp.]|nr:LytTR family DNA-binding domain-containing protein [Allosphingosinicella sp.]